MNKSSLVPKYLHKTFVAMLCGFIASSSTSPVWALEGSGLNTKANTAPPASLGEAKRLIDLADTRGVGTFKSAEDETYFRALIHANVVTGFVDDEKGFLEYWNKNKKDILAQQPLVGQGPISWQMFLAQTYTRFKIDSTNAAADPRALKKWLETVVDNPWIEWASWKTWAAAAGAYLFIQGVVKGAMVAGPAAGAINSAINPVMTPINQKLTVKGNKYLGPVGMRLNAWLFDGKESGGETKEAKVALTGLRSLIEGKSYQVSSENWDAGMKSLYKYWNSLNFLWSLIPDAYKGGRDRMADLVVRFPRDFAQAATTSMTAAEVQRQGAESILDRLMMKGGDAQAVEQLGQSLREQIQAQMKTELDQPQKAVELQAGIESGKAELIRLGATTEQAERFVENTRKVFVFRRQAAGMLAGQLIHDVMFSDTIKGAETAYKEFMSSMGMDYMHQELKESVSEILNRLEFKIDVKSSVAESVSVPALSEKAGVEKGVMEKVMKFNSASPAKASLMEPGSLLNREAQTAPERVKEAVGRASRR